jgi:PAS domain S-box-containing protein
MPRDIRKAPALFEKNDRLRRFVPLGIILIGIVVLAGLALVITQRMNILREAPADNLTWTLSQVEVDVLVLMDEALLVAQSESPNVAEIRRRFDNLYSRTSVLREAPVFANVRTDPVFAEQLKGFEADLTRLSVIVDSSDPDLLDNLQLLITELKPVREKAHAIAITGIKIRSQSSDFERASLARLLLVAAIVTMATIFFLGFVLVLIMRQYQLRQEAIEAVARANARLKSTFDVSLDAIVVANADGIILEFNKAAETVFGFTASEAVGQEMSQMIMPEHLRAAHIAGMERINKTNEARLVGKGRIEITALRKSGEEFPVEISIGMALDHRGTIFISYLRDITERVAAEQDLKAARDDALAAEKAKSNFLAVMSHEMRTPLNGIFGTLELLGNFKITKKQRNYLAIAKRSGDTLLNHVNDVLDISRIDAEKMELVEDRFDLAQFFADVITTNEATADAQRNTLKLHMGNMPIDTVLMDERRMRQITYNLISNALKFTNNGTVTLSANTFADPSGQRTLVFSVVDTGVGIHETEQPHVFERFYTQERSYDRFASGAGLGLAICKQLIEMMGGTISLKSNVGKGSSFTVSVPFKIDTSPKEAVPTAEKSVDLSALQDQKILLAEDNEINRLIVHEMLKTNGMIVHEAHNGQEAVDLAHAHAYAVILMDISMPIMNGADATHLIRTTDGPNQGAKIIGLTAHALPEEHTRFIASGMDSVLNKPISQATLLRALVMAIQDNNLDRHSMHEQTNTDLISSETFAELEQILQPARLQKLISDFDVEITALLAHIPLLLDAGDMGVLATDTHKSIGSSGMIGAHHLQKLLRELEQAAKTKDADHAKTQAASVISAWPATQSALLAKSYTLG